MYTLQERGNFALYSVIITEYHGNFLLIICDNMFYCRMPSETISFLKSCFISSIPFKNGIANLKICTCMK